MRAASKPASAFVDTRALDTAQTLSGLAVTRTEQGYAEEALRLADLSVDLAFAAALRDAVENPAPLTLQTQALAARVKAAEDRVTTDQDRVIQLTQQVAKARGSAKDSLQRDLDLAQAQLSLDQDELQDAQQDLIRAGGDKHAAIQKLLDAHEASAEHGSKTNVAASSNGSLRSVESPDSSSVAAQLRAWMSLRDKERQLRQAQQNGLARQASLTSEHERLEKEVEEEKAQKKILHKAKPAPVAPANPGGESATDEKTATLAFLRDLASDQKGLGELGQRIETEQELAAVYANWIAYVMVREQAFLHGLFLCASWILLIALLVFIVNHWVQRFFTGVAQERRKLHTMRAVTLLAIQALGLFLILLVIFGRPNNFGTVLALAGAGLTVALKDFILGFIGWFVLMGKDGISPGDWVEINGVGGEVLEVGPFRTVLLETGNWTDAAHPTGRKVTFGNSFAVEGHYFNFSTSGQWLWDELQVQVPQDADPYSVAEAIKKIATDETAENAHLAEQEWEHAVPAYAKRTFSAVPSMSIQPAGSGVSVLVRYITRARERQEVRSRVYRAVVELLRRKNLPESAARQPSDSAIAGRAEPGPVDAKGIKEPRRDGN